MELSHPIQAMAAQNVNNAGGSKKLRFIFLPPHQ
jgi:hypothetical protein